MMELGLFTFVDNNKNPNTGEKLHPSTRLEHLLEEAKLADQAGLDVFGIGEHHREEYLASSPVTLLSAIAAQTNNIKLTSAVTVLGSEDPVRVFQQFATLDLLSKGRAEIMVGRGSFIESFPLFGFNLNDYEALFDEKLDLLLQLRESKLINWQGRFRPSIPNKEIYPQPMQSKLPIWRAVGGTPKSCYDAGKAGLPLAIAIIGGEPAYFKQFANFHKQGAEDAGLTVPKISINSHGFIADSEQKALDISFLPFKQTMDKIGSERGWSPMSRPQFEASTELKGANFIGSPQQIIDKIMYQYEIFKHNRFLMQMSVGSISHSDMMHSIELFATKVAPIIRAETSE